MKSIAPRWSANGKYLFLLGLCLLAAAISVATVAGSWNPVAIGLAIAGGVCILLWLIFQTAFSRGFWGQRSTQAGANALLSTLAVLIILGLINFLVIQYSNRLDLTENQFLSLASQTQAVLSQLKQPVKVLVFQTPSQPDPSVRPLLEEYQRRGGGKFSFELIDPQAQPALAQKYDIQNQGPVILESGGRTQPLRANLSEVNLTPAIERVVSDRRSQVFFTLGHGELPLQGDQNSLSQAAAALKLKNIFPEPLNLIQVGKVPEQADAVIIAGPKQAFLPAEDKLLQAYLKGGGSLLLMVDPGIKTGLDELLKSWGVKFDDRPIIDASGAGQLIGYGPAVAVVTQYGQHPITRDFGQSFSFFPLAQGINISSTSPDQQVTDLLKSNDQTWAEGDPNNPDLRFNPEQDRQGPLSLGVAMTQQLPSVGSAPVQKARMVIFGDSEFALDGTFNQGLNGDLFLNSVTWLTDRSDQALSIRPKEPTNRRLQLTTATNRWLIFLSVGILPFGSLIAAVGIWWKRR
jgi:ABC-type uncharacterized transport system involved in gliding motility auxiliary subunit